MRARIGSDGRTRGVGRRIRGVGVWPGESLLSRHDYFRLWYLYSSNVISLHILRSSASVSVQTSPPTQPRTLHSGTTSRTSNYTTRQALTTTTNQIHRPPISLRPTKLV